MLVFSRTRVQVGESIEEFVLFEVFFPSSKLLVYEVDVRIEKKHAAVFQLDRKQCVVFKRINEGC